MTQENSDSFSVVNYDKVASSPAFHPITRMTALMLQKNSYMTLADFFNGLSDKDIADLCEMVNDCEVDDFAAKNLAILSEMLSSAEGLASDSIEKSIKNINSLCIFITCVSLARKGLVEAMLENMSFGEDMDHETIVKKL